MRPSKAHFVTSCQQLLALGAVLAVLTPAAAVISLDVVRQVPSPAGAGHQAGSGHPVALTAYTREAERATRVPTEPVDADITDYQLTAAHGVAGRAAVAARTVTGGRAGTTAVVSRPEPVVGYGGVGVTWEPDTRITDKDLGFEVRSRADGTWSEWTTLAYDAEHGPDPDSREGRHARPGTDVMFVGDVDDVQVRATAQHVAPPAGMRMEVVAPGKAVETDKEVPAIDTAASSRSAVSETVAEDASARLAPFTPQPKIFSRAQWGANENLRDKGSLRYYEVHAGFVHHTVNANDYSRSQVPGILRSIYAYHTQSRGWSDVGYNFLVDRFGRIWEGRYGGVDRPVVGAHTLGYNDYAFAMSAIGNYDIKKPSRAMVQAYGTLFAWKLSLHGIDASSTRQRVGSHWFQAINGHRDAGQTACPGRYLYARLGRIRRLAEQAQRDWSGRDLHSDLAGSQYPDLIARRASDKRLFVIRTGGLSGFHRPTKSPGLASGADLVVASPDLTGDKVADLLIRGNDGSARVHPGDGQGRYGAGTNTTAGFANRDLVTAVGDLNRDGDNDLVARKPNGRLQAYFGSGSGGFTRKGIRGSWGGYSMLAATGDLDGDGRVDLLARDDDGKLWVRRGVRPRRFGARVAVQGSWTHMKSITGFGDFNRDGRADLFVRDSGHAPGWIVPSRGGLGFGQPLGPIRRFRGAGTISAAGRFGGEGLPDVVSRRGDTVLTYVNSGRVELEQPIDTGLRARGASMLLNAGDWDRDGHGDIILRNRKGALFLRRGDGTGHFPDSVRIGGRGFRKVSLLAAVGDATGDGFPDLMGQPRGSAMRIYPGRGGNGLGNSYVAHGAISAGKQVPIGRWDGDGAPDSLFRSGPSVSLYPGNGPGGLTNRRSVKVNLGGYDWTVGISDIRAKGHSDVIVRERSTGRLYVWQTNAKQGFTARRLLGEGFSGYDLVD